MQSPIIPTCPEPRQPVTHLTPLAVSNMAAVLDLTLTDISNSEGMRMDDYSAETQAALSDADIAESFGIEAQMLFEAVEDGTATPAQCAQHSLVERVMAQACLLCEMRIDKEQQA